MARAKPLAGMPRTRRSSRATPMATRRRRRPTTNRRRNFLALTFCLMVGTAALPHILMRYYTTPSVKEARESVTWSLFFIFLLYFTAPAWRCWSSTRCSTCWWARRSTSCRPGSPTGARVDPALLSVVDINKDGIFQLGEMRIGGDIIVLATPEIGGLPYVISGMVAAGGLAAALSTADGLLLTIANALSHDLYYKMIDPNAPTARRVMISKALLLVVAWRGLGGGAETGGHPVPGLGGVLVRGGGLLPGADPGHLLEARQQVGRVAGHGRRPGHHVLLHGHDPALAARHLRRHLAGGTVVRHPADLGRCVRRAAGLCGDHHRQPADAGARRSAEHAGTGGACALPEPEARPARCSRSARCWAGVPSPPPTRPAATPSA
jgi:hypothetical protein